MDDCNRVNDTLHKNSTEEIAFTLTIEPTIIAFEKHSLFTSIFRCKCILTDMNASDDEYMEIYR